MRTIDEHAVKACGGEILPDGSGIRIGGWKITSQRGPIAADATAERFKEDLGVIAIPEQWYDTNKLEVLHEGSGTLLSFTGEDALRAWHAHQLQAVHIPASEQWTKSRKFEMEAHHAKQLEYDWTFTPDYSCSTTTASTTPSAEWEATGDQMDRTLLTSRDPILFFEELPLYESELEDTGTSCLTVKVRVMPRCWYVLLRFFLRVDGVLVRLRETRLFCKFSTSNNGGGASEEEKVEVLREIKYQEGSFDELTAGGAPPEGAAYADGEAAAVVLQAVAPVGVKKYCMEKLTIS